MKQFQLVELRHDIEEDGVLVKKGEIGVVIDAPNDSKLAFVQFMPCQEALAVTRDSVVECE